MNEYTSMSEKVQALRERLETESGQEVSALELEKMAYVLGKEAQPGSERYSVDEEVAEEGEKKAEKSPRKRKGNASTDGQEEKRPGRQPEMKKRKNTITTADAETNNMPTSTKRKASNPTSVSEPSPDIPRQQ